jgi:hypothetical protein
MTIQFNLKTSLSKTDRTYAVIPASTSGITEAIDIGGLAVCAVEASTGINPSFIAFRGSMGSDTDISPIYNVLAGRIAFGSTDQMGGNMMVIDPPIFAALRFLQIETITSTGGTVAQSTSASFRLCVTERT